MRKEIVALLAIAAVGVAAVVASIALSNYLNGPQKEVKLQVDKTSYAIGEDVTFQLVSMDRNANFLITGDSADCGIYIGKLPTGVTIDEFLGNFTSVMNSPFWYQNSPQVTFSQFRGNSGPLSLIWDGTFPSYNDSSGEWEDCLATSGYYFLAAKYMVTQGDYPELRTDSSSVFYLNSLNVTEELYFSATSGSHTLDLTISPGGSHASHGQLNSTFQYPDTREVPVGSNESGYTMSVRYLNDTLTLTDGEWRETITVVPRLDSGYSYFDARVATDVGTFTFGIMAQVTGDLIDHQIYR